MSKNISFDSFKLSDLLYTKFSLVDQFETDISATENNLREYTERELERLAEIRQEHSELSESELNKYISDDWRLATIRETIRRYNARIYLLKILSENVVNI